MLISLKYFRLKKSAHQLLLTAAINERLCSTIIITALGKKVNRDDVLLFY
jgi:hypothetical protein